MADSRFVRLDHRAVLTVGGADRAGFLQGLISNEDIDFRHIKFIAKRPTASK